MPGVEDNSALGHIGVFSDGIQRIRNLPAFLGAPVCAAPRSPCGLSAIAGWGHKDTASRARALAASWKLPYLALEDGFYRSLDLGVNGAQPLSLVVDPVGVYYDATRPSLVENILQGLEPGLDDPGLATRAQVLISRILEAGLSKYNHAPDLPEDFFAPARGRVLVVDQTRDDHSVLLGLAGEHSFRAMLQAAAAENVGAEIWLKPHPDVLAGKKRGYLHLSVPEGVRVLTSDAAPHSVLRHMDRVYTVSSQLGFEALLRGLPVRCFGMPFYAGWGATQDELPCPRRTRTRGVAEIFVAACLLATRCVDPYSGEPCGLERILEVLALCRRHNEANAGPIVCLGFQRWKRPFARAFLGSTQGSLHFISRSGRAVELARRLSARMVVWAANEPKDLACRARAAGTPLLRMEDGFLRSTGLGSNFARPYSLILDSQGIYFNAGAPSDLEALLEAGGLPQELLARARRLREEIARRGLTKYNLAGDAPTFEMAQGRSILLVPGQVADDASVRLGGAGISGNLELLHAVRQARPGAFVVYKPHPDVLAGNRKGHVPAADLERLCDAVVDNVSMNELLPHVHEVHTLSSLTGFEALLRGVPVCTYGAPFYAGWGLTTDRAVFPRRTRRVSLDELIAGTLLLYPRYFDWESGLPCEAEVLLTRLAAQIQPNISGGLVQRLNHWATYLMRILSTR